MTEFECKAARTLQAALAASRDYSELDALVLNVADGLAGENAVGTASGSSLPFRTPDLLEMIKEVGYTGWFDGDNALTTTQRIDVIGNCFVPNILAAQVGGLPFQQFVAHAEASAPASCRAFQLMEWY